MWKVKNNEQELVNEMCKYRLDVLCVSETYCKGCAFVCERNDIVGIYDEKIMSE